MPDRWPRGLREKDAAEYVGLSVTSIRTLRAALDFAAPVQLTPGRLVYLREDLDAWLDHRAGRVPKPPEDEWLDVIRAMENLAAQNKRQSFRNRR